MAYAGLTWRSSVLLGIGTAGLVIFIIMMISVLVDEVTAVSVALWFGIPGLAAVGYALFSLEQLVQDTATDE